MTKLIINYFTINQTLTLQNFTRGGVEIPLLYKEFCKNVNKKYNMIKFTFYL